MGCGASTAHPGGRPATEDALAALRRRPSFRLFHNKGAPRPALEKLLQLFASGDADGDGSLSPRTTTSAPASAWGGTSTPTAS